MHNNSGERAEPAGGTYRPGSTYLAGARLLNAYDAAAGAFARAETS